MTNVESLAPGDMWHSLKKKKCNLQWIKKHVRWEGFSISNMGSDYLAAVLPVPLKPFFKNPCQLMTWILIWQFLSNRKISVDIHQIRTICIAMGKEPSVAWRLFLGSFLWYIFIPVKSRQLMSKLGTAGFICGCLTFKWIAVTWLDMVQFNSHN